MRQPLFDLEFLPDDFDFKDTRIISNYEKINDERFDPAKLTVHSFDNEIIKQNPEIYESMIRKLSHREESNKHESYEFDSILGSGAQGLIIKYSNKDRSVVMKFFPNSIKKESSTRFENDEGYKPFLNEEDMMKHLNIFFRMQPIFESLRIQNEVSISKEGELINSDGTIMPGNYFITFAIDYFNRRDNFLKGLQECSVTPVIVDKISRIKKGDETYFPAANPQSFGPMAFFSSYSNPISIYSYEEGNTLEKILLTNKLSNTQRIDLINSLVYSVSYIHEIGILHRDLKPENIIVNPNGLVKLLDFGISQFLYPSDRVARYCDLLEYKTKEIDSQFATSKDWQGSRLFSSPQTYHRTNTSNKDDIFSLGILMSIILENKHPYLDINKYSDYMKLNSEEKLKIKREYSSLNSEPTKKNSSINKMYFKYCENAETELKKLISQMINPNEDERINRVGLVTQKLGIDPPNLPPIFENSEFFRSKQKSYSCSEKELYYNMFKEKLPKALAFSFFPDYFTLI